MTIDKLQKELNAIDKKLFADTDKNGKLTSINYLGMSLQFILYDAENNKFDHEFCTKLLSKGQNQKLKEAIREQIANEAR